MTDQIKISIPMPLVVSIEDVGWWSGADGSPWNQPFRTGMPRDHVPGDYTALAALGKALDAKILAGFVLCEWDRENILQHLPSSTWMGKKWRTPGNNDGQRQEAASIIRENSRYIEFGLHGVGHEFWTASGFERTEFHDDACRMRQKDEVIRHLDYFFRIMDQYAFGVKPRTFIPPALRHSFGNGDAGFQKILNRFGIRYVTLVFSRAKRYSPPQTETIAWENDVLLVERGEAEVKWNHVACSPRFKFDRPVMALHWANILHADPGRNLEVIENWAGYIRDMAGKKGILIAQDCESAFTQYLHRVMSRVEKCGQGFCLDLKWRKTVPGKLVGNSFFIKVDAPQGTELRISGTRRLASDRPAEKKFIKLAVPEQGQKILIQPEKIESGDF